MAIKKSTRKITLEASDKLTVFFKQNESKEIFADLENKFNVNIKINAVGILVVKGSKESTAKLEECFNRLKNSKKTIAIQDIYNILEGKVEVEEENFDSSSNNYRMEFRNNRSSIVITAKTKRQEEFIDAILNKKVILGMGSPGTGKSFIALAVALKLLETKRIHKIIISKPPIESGPSMGYLPGTSEDKMAPYIESVMSILTEIVGFEKRKKLVDSGTIQIENIGFLRGMTLGNRDSIVYILDEAQNVEFAQHKLILTRLGSQAESRIIMCGDQNQSDLRYKKDTLSKIYNIIKDSPYVGSVVFQREDVVRSEVVKDLLGRIEQYEEDTANKDNGRK